MHRESFRQEGVFEFHLILILFQGRIWTVEVPGELLLPGTQNVILTIDNFDVDEKGCLKLAQTQFLRDQKTLPSRR